MTELVHAYEARIFDDYVQDVGHLSKIHGQWSIHGDFNVILSAAKRLFGRGTTMKIDGSMAKGTQVRGSDLDFLVDTESPVTPEQRRELASLLKKNLHFKSHSIELG